MSYQHGGAIHCDRCHGDGKARLPNMLQDLFGEGDEWWLWRLLGLNCPYCAGQGQIGEWGTIKAVANETAVTA